MSAPWERTSPAECVPRLTLLYNGGYSSSPEERGHRTCEFSSVALRLQSKLSFSSSTDTGCLLHLNTSSSEHQLEDHTINMLDRSCRLLAINVTTNCGFTAGCRLQMHLLQAYTVHYTVQTRPVTQPDNRSLMKPHMNLLPYCTHSVNSSRKIEGERSPARRWLISVSSLLLVFSAPAKNCVHITPAT